jgi:hypothetical protein
LKASKSQETDATRGGLIPVADSPAFNILSCSTRAWSFGDDCIWLGIQYLFRRVCFHCDWNWIRHGNEHNGRRDEAGSSSTPRTDLDTIDLVVATGSPEWNGSQYSALINLQSIVTLPWLFLGLDHTGRDLKLSVEEHNVLSKGLVIVRESLAYAVLRNAGIHGWMLPCPSLFASDWEHPSRRVRSIALTVHAENRNKTPCAADTEMMAEVARKLSRIFEVRASSDSINVFFELPLYLHRNVLYHRDLNEQMKLFSSCDLVVTNHYYTGLIANSMLKPALFVTPQPDSFRDTALYPYIVNSRPEDVLRQVQEIDFDALSRKLLNWKINMEQQYLMVLRPWFQTHALDLI